MLDNPCWRRAGVVPEPDRPTRLFRWPVAFWGGGRRSWRFSRGDLRRKMTLLLGGISLPVACPIARAPRRMRRSSDWSLLPQAE